MPVKKSMMPFIKYLLSAVYCILSLNLVATTYHFDKIT
jgi:hypothetical protein